MDDLQLVVVDSRAPFRSVCLIGWLFNRINPRFVISPPFHRRHPNLRPFFLLPDDDRRRGGNSKPRSTDFSSLFFSRPFCIRERPFIIGFRRFFPPFPFSSEVDSTRAAFVCVLAGSCYTSSSSSTTSYTQARSSSAHSIGTRRTDSDGVVMREAKTLSPNFSKNGEKVISLSLNAL